MASTFHGGQAEQQTANVRVKLPEKDDDDLSEVDNEAEVSGRESERGVERGGGE